MTTNPWTISNAPDSELRAIVAYSDVTEKFRQAARDELRRRAELPATKSEIYGSQISASEYNPLRSLIATPEVAPAGNLVLRVGREHSRHFYGYGADIVGGWEQTEYVVMLPDEAREFAQSILDTLRADEIRRELANEPDRADRWAEQNPCPPHLGGPGAS